MALDRELLIAANDVRVVDGNLTVHLATGEWIGVPLDRFPTLQSAAPSDLLRYELLADGTIIHWPALDEDLSVFGLLPARLRAAVTDATQTSREARVISPRASYVFAGLAGSSFAVMATAARPRTARILRTGNRRSIAASPMTARRARSHQIPA